jgi:hypothetical protein
MPTDVITVRDIELFVVGSLCIVLMPVLGVRADGSIDPVPVVLLLALGALSFGLALWDIRTRQTESDAIDPTEPTES